MKYYFIGLPALLTAVGIILLLNIPTLDKEKMNAIEELKIAGSSTVFPIVSSASSSFKVITDSLKIELTESGSGSGIESLINQEIDLANSSRPINEDEYKMAKSKGLNPQMTVIANDAIVIITHPDNPIENINMEDLKMIFSSNQVLPWSDFVKDYDFDITPVGTDPEKSGTADYFFESVDLKNAISGQYEGLEHTSDIDEFVRENPQSIGFTSLKYALEAGESIKVLKLEGVEASVENILNTSYPISRRLYLISPDKLNGQKRNFINFILSSEGQKIVEEQGYISIN